MKTTGLALLTAAGMLLGACGHSSTARTATVSEEAITAPSPANQPSPSATEPASTAPAQTADGYTLLKQRCYICHLERPVHGDTTVQMQAPPMMGVKRHYLEKYPDKEDFVRAITQWVKHPDSTKALMPGAVREFGLMPAFPYSDADLRKIAEAIYDQIPNPGPNHKCGEGRGMHGKHLRRGFGRHGRRDF